MNTKFEDNTVLPEAPAFKEMTEAEMEKDSEKLDEIYKGVIHGINETLEEGDK